MAQKSKILQLTRLSEHFTHISQSKALRELHDKKYFAVKLYGWHVLRMVAKPTNSRHSGLKAVQAIDRYNQQSHHTTYRQIKMCRFFAFRINSWFVLTKPAQP